MPVPAKASSSAHATWRAAIWSDVTPSNAALHSLAAEGALRRLRSPLAQTTLDISGDVLKLPFACCAFLFDDALTLDLVQALVKRTRTTRDCPFRMLTVYVFAIPRDVGETSLRFVFLADAFDKEWPYLVTREVPLDGKRNLDQILESHPSPDDQDPPDPFFYCEEIRALLHLAINGVLYATSSDFVSEVREPPRRTALGIRREPLDLSGETVFYLPNRIVVGPKPFTKERPSDGGDRQINKRFWVRGHWRKPNPSWRDRPWTNGSTKTSRVWRGMLAGAR